MPSDHLEQGTIQTLAFGGEGLIKNTGKVVFVPFTIPQEVVSYHIVEEKKNFAKAHLKEVLQPAEQRQIPRCQHFGICGGCQLQHLPYSLQLDWKRIWIQEALQRVGKLTDVKVEPVIGTSQHWFYRRHIRLKLRPNPIKLEMGYIRYDLEGLVSINECPIFENQNIWLAELKYLIAQFDASLADSNDSLVIYKSSNSYLLHFNFKHLPRSLDEIFKQFLDTQKLFQGIFVSFQHQVKHFGHTAHEIQVESLKIQTSPLVFNQNHPEISSKIYSDLLLHAQGYKKVLDLYCGIGITSLLLAKQGSLVTGIEINQQALELAKENARNNQLEIDFYAEDAALALKKRSRGQPWDLLLVNPPRVGLSESMYPFINPQNFKKVLYVSCMPATLARDLRAIVQNGYRVAHVQPYDMFPQTTHVETLVVLEKN